MRSSIFISILAIASICVAWVIPSDLPDGVWDITLTEDDDGVAGHTIQKRGDLESNMALTEGDMTRKEEDDGLSRHTIQKREHLDGEIDPSLLIDGKNHTESTDLLGPPEPRLPLRPYGKKNRYKKFKISHFQCVFFEPDLYDPAYKLAKENLFAYCKRYQLPKRTVHIAAAKSGDVIVYACNWGRKLTTCDESEWISGERWYLDRYCGSMQPGWFVSRNSRKTYGRAWIGSDVCRKNAFGKQAHVRKHTWIDKPKEWGKDVEIPPEENEKKGNFVFDILPYVPEYKGIKSPWAPTNHPINVTYNETGLVIPGYHD
ncbi:hypothetical protein B0T10DRAFT_608176 [Thelonectria olida]|uniref:Uncharacterized protein n=1 Tax=Thelonectria olida TaxID=1576542 RepID=A0A9P8W2P8_9HYPO|nr:hypothetical protein B0T10DRAFT_608176 [Thelonectria olida]